MLETTDRLALALSSVLGKRTEASALQSPQLRWRGGTAPLTRGGSHPPSRRSSARLGKSRRGELPRPSRAAAARGRKKESRKDQRRVKEAPRPVATAPRGARPIRCVRAVRPRDAGPTRRYVRARVSAPADPSHCSATARRTYESQSQARSRSPLVRSRRPQGSPRIRPPHARARHGRAHRPRARRAEPGMAPWMRREWRVRRRRLLGPSSGEAPHFVDVGWFVFAPSASGQAGDVPSWTRNIADADVLSTGGGHLHHKRRINHMHMLVLV